MIPTGAQTLLGTAKPEPGPAAGPGDENGESMTESPDICHPQLCPAGLRAGRGVCAIPGQQRGTLGQRDTHQWSVCAVLGRGSEAQGARL